MKVHIVTDDGTCWDTMEWDNKTLAENTDARGLFARMIAQSIQEWAEDTQLKAKIRASRLQREAAKEEVEVEQQRAAHEMDIE